MRTSLAIPGVLVVCAATMWSCSGGSMPSSPSMLGSPAAAGALPRASDASRAAASLRPLDDAPTAPTPMSVIINIVGSIGAAAFMPNPTTANVGDQIVFTNNDAVLHHIVLDNGTDLGDVAPGASSAPTPLTAPTATFHCTIHPSMVGGINVDATPPMPEPYYPPPDDYYGYY